MSLDRPGDELRTVVTANMFGHATNREQIRQHVDDFVSGHASFHLQGQAFTCVLIDQRKPLQGPAATRTVENKVPRPDVVRMLGPTTCATVATVSQAPLFPLFLRYFQPFPSPQPIQTLAIHGPSL